MAFKSTKSNTSNTSISSLNPDKKSLNDFRIEFKDVKFEKSIGSGFFGKVYKANWLGTEIAVKRLNDTQDEESFKKFKAETMILRGARHPNVVGFIGYVADPKRGWYIVTEYVAGGSLREVLRARKDYTLDWPLRKRIALDIAKAMSYLHARKIIHRDLKTGNILLDEYMRAKVADFGLARSFSRDHSNLSVVGTPIFMAPEVLLGKGYTEKADVFGFGLILFEIILRKKCEPDVFRTKDFSMNLDEFNRVVPSSVPPSFVALFEAVTQTNPALRPSFIDIIEMIEAMPIALPQSMQEQLKNNASGSNRGSSQNSNTNRSILNGRLPSPSIVSNDYYSDSSASESSPSPLPGQSFKGDDIKKGTSKKKSNGSSGRASNSKRSSSKTDQNENDTADPSSLGAPSYAKAKSSGTAQGVQDDKEAIVEGDPGEHSSGSIKPFTIFKLPSKRKK